MMEHRLRMAGLPGRVVQGSMLECPFPDSAVDTVISIGCFHHTGDIQRCIDEAHRVLKPGGALFFMVYNRFSYRQWRRWPKATARALLGELVTGSNGAGATREQRAAYDSNAQGEAAPETSFVSIRGLRSMLERFSSIEFRKENCDELRLLRSRIRVPRMKALPYIGPLLGLDIYVSAIK
jgi:SAM-dependent methyltransferase